MSVAPQLGPGAAGDAAVNLDALLRSAEAARTAGRHAVGARYAAQAVHLAEAVGSTALHARALNLLGIHQLRIGDHEPCIATLQDATRLLEQLNDLPGLSSALNTMAMAFSELGLHEEAHETVSRSLDAAKQSGDPLTLAWAYNRAGITHDRLGDHASGVASLTFALGLAREVDDNEAIFAALNNLVESCRDVLTADIEAGRPRPAEDWLARAKAYAEEGLALARASGNAHREAVILLAYGSLLALAGEYDQALELLLSADTLARREQFRPLTLGARKWIAEILFNRGEVDQAIASYTAVLHQAAQSSDSELQLQVRLALSRAYKRAGKFEAALEQYEQYHALERRIHTQTAETRARLLVNRLELDRARLEAERATLEAAMQQIRNHELEAQKVALEQEAQLLMRQAHEDGLTGLWNRHYVERELPRLIAQARSLDQPLSVALIDVDRFKTVNDRFGHLVGDEALRRFARILRTSVRPSDLVARLGGEEFLIALPGATVEAAEGLSRRLCVATRSADWADILQDAGLSVSVGVTALGDSDQMPDAAVAELLTRADVALYSAKDRGRDRVEVWQTS